MGARLGVVEQEGTLTCWLRSRSCHQLLAVLVLGPLRTPTTIGRDAEARQVLGGVCSTGAIMLHTCRCCL